MQLPIKGRQIYHYTCAQCPSDKLYRDKDIVMDHIHPVVDPLIGYKDLETYADRMFPEEDGWQRLCEKHHDLKTEQENAIRKLNKQPVVKKSRKKKT